MSLELIIDQNNIKEEDISQVFSPSHLDIFEKHEEKLIWRTKSKVSVTKDFSTCIRLINQNDSSARFFVSPVTYNDFKYAGILSLVPNFPEMISDDFINGFSFFIDNSGSMFGKGIELSRQIQSLFIRFLSKNEKRNVVYNFIRFGSSFEYLFNHPSSIESYENMDLAKKYISEKCSSDLGGTNLLNPLNDYLSSLLSKKKDIRRNIFIVTDGICIYNDEIIDLLKRSHEEFGVRCFCIVMMGELIDRKFFQNCARVTNGFTVFIDENNVSDMEAIVCRLVSLSFCRSIRNVKIMGVCEKSIFHDDHEKKKKKEDDLIVIPVVFNRIGHYESFFLKEFPEKISVSYTFEIDNGIKEEKIESVQQILLKHPPQEQHLLDNEGGQGRTTRIIGMDRQAQASPVSILASQALYDLHKKEKKIVMTKSEQIELGMKFNILTEHTCFFLEQHSEDSSSTELLKTSVILSPSKSVESNNVLNLQNFEYTNPEKQPKYIQNPISLNDDTKYFEEEFTEEKLSSTSKPTSTKSKSYQSDLSKYGMYELKVIGRSVTSFAKTLKVRDLETTDFFAIKSFKKTNERSVLHAINEKKIMMKFQDYPFIVKLRKSIQTPSKLYLAYDYISGGELFFHLKDQTRFDVLTARFYLSEIILVFEYIHKHGIIYVDFRPENVMLDSSGHIVMTSISKKTKDNFSVGSVPEYFAPEVISGDITFCKELFEMEKRVDWWCLGVFLYEMITGLPPLYSENINEMYDMILLGKTKIEFSDRTFGIGGKKNKVDDEELINKAKDLIMKLMERDPMKRFNEGIEELKIHPFFEGMDWEGILEKKVKPPFVPGNLDQKIQWMEPDFIG